jgi:hypothetical protein
LCPGVEESVTHIADQITIGHLKVIALVLGMQLWVYKVLLIPLGMGQQGKHGAVLVGTVQKPGLIS